MSTFASMGTPPMVTVVEADNFVMPFEESLIDRQPGYLTVVDHFEMPDSASLDEAIFEGVQRAEASLEDDANMATLYFWNAGALAMTVSGGILLNPAPAPLSSDRIVETLKQLALHPNYQGQRVMTTSAIDGITCTLKDGETKKETL